MGTGVTTDKKLDAIESHIRHVDGDLAEVDDYWEVGGPPGGSLKRSSWNVRTTNS